MDLTDHEKMFLGQGWNFPVEIDPKGGMALTKGSRDIEASISVILGTSKGERVMRPEFGSSIHEFVFAPNNATTHGLIAYHVRDALAFWEPRIDVRNVIVDTDRFNPSRVLIDIEYMIKATNDERNLVYPFYLIPREE